MTTQETIEAYFHALGNGKGWEALLADDLKFTSFTSPVKTIAGKEAFLEGTKRFYSAVNKVELRDLIVAGDRACALTSYELRGPEGCTFSSDVAEIFSARHGKITSFGIYFDTAPYPARQPGAERSTAATGS